MAIVVDFRFGLGGVDPMSSIAANDIYTFSELTSVLWALDITLNRLVFAPYVQIPVSGVVCLPCSRVYAC